jgi:hypothetical protein
MLRYAVIERNVSSPRFHETLRLAPQLSRLAVLGPFAYEV